MNARVARSTRASTFSRIAESCLRGLRPSGEGEATPAISCSFNPATRTWKNSSRLEAKMAMNFARSSSGRPPSSARASTRSLKSSQDSSRLKVRGSSSGHAGGSRPGGAPTSGSTDIG